MPELTGTRCRCGVCKRTFRNLAAFDAHRPGQRECGGTDGMTLAEGRAYPAWRLDRG